MRVADEENLVSGFEQFHKIQTAAAVDEQKYAAVVLVLVKYPLHALHAHHRRYAEHDVLISEEILNNFAGTNGIDVNICNDNYTLSSQEIDELPSQVSHKHPYVSVTLNLIHYFELDAAKN